MSIMHSCWLLDVEFDGGWPNLRFFCDHLTPALFVNDQPRMVSLDAGAIPKPAKATKRNKLIYRALNGKTKRCPRKSSLGPEEFSCLNSRPVRLKNLSPSLASLQH
jgi:hypothetical protein